MVRSARWQGSFSNDTPFAFMALNVHPTPLEFSPILPIIPASVIMLMSRPEECRFLMKKLDEVGVASTTGYADGRNRHQWGKPTSRNEHAFLIFAQMQKSMQKSGRIAHNAY